MEEKINSILEFFEGQKCKDVRVYDLSKEKRLAKIMIIITSPNFLENKKLASEFVEFAGIDSQPEGFNKGEWIIFDLNEIVVHSFIPIAREKYNLDKLWQKNQIKNINEAKQGKKSKK